MYPPEYTVTVATSSIGYTMYGPQVIVTGTRSALTLFHEHLSIEVVLIFHLVYLERCGYLVMLLTIIGQLSPYSALLRMSWVCDAFESLARAAVSHVP